MRAHLSAPSSVLRSVSPRTSFCHPNEPSHFILSSPRVVSSALPSPLFQPCVHPCVLLRVCMHHSCVRTRVRLLSSRMWHPRRHQSRQPMCKPCRSCSDVRKLAHVHTPHTKPLFATPSQHFTCCIPPAHAGASTAAAPPQPRRDVGVWCLLAANGRGRSYRAAGRT